MSATDAGQRRLLPEVRGLAMSPRDRLEALGWRTRARSFAPGRVHLYAAKGCQAFGWRGREGKEPEAWRELLKTVETATQESRVLASFYSRAP